MNKGKTTKAKAWAIKEQQVEHVILQNTIKCLSNWSHVSNTIQIDLFFRNEWLVVHLHSSYLNKNQICTSINDTHYGKYPIFLANKQRLLENKSKPCFISHHTIWAPFLLSIVIQWSGWGGGFQKEKPIWLAMALSLSSSPSSTLFDAKAPRQLSAAGSSQCASLPTLSPPPLPSQSRCVWKTTTYCKLIYAFVDTLDRSGVQDLYLFLLINRCLG